MNELRQTVCKCKICGNIVDYNELRDHLEQHDKNAQIIKIIDVESNFHICSFSTAIEDCIDTVYELAEQNALDPETCELDLFEEAARQQACLSVVHDFIMNNIHR